ncbi:exopolysaccharide biosynthesis protein [Rhizorhabdus argentea]|uniref:exopolysaccharide biosynthesis protein n=1 Tax=Rhizorhabdus argentea TaxID=1387174 RepID=UPI0030EEA302
MSTIPDAARAADANACAVSPVSATRLTDTLDVLASGCAGARISLDDLTSTLGEKCFAGLIFLLAAPNMLPLPPGCDIALSVPLIILSAQLVLGVRRPWLPAWIRRREVTTERFAKAVERLRPLTRRAEILLSRRLDALTGLAGRRMLGLLCLALAVLLALPVPLGNAVPAAAISLFALGLLARDGIAVLAGVAVMIASVAIVAGLGYAAIEAWVWFVEKMPG